jgi:hypothetical protein
MVSGSFSDARGKVLSRLKFTEEKPMSEAMEGIKSLSTGEPTLDVQAIADAAARKIVEAISAAPAESESSRLQSEADPAAVVSPEKPTTVSAPETPVMPLTLRTLTTREVNSDCG